MKKLKRVLSLRAFAKLAGLTPMGVQYHIEKGHIKTEERQVLGINEDQLEIIKKYSKDQKK